MPPRTTAGYSGKPLAVKLGIKPGFLVNLWHAPPHYAQLVDPLPAGVRFGEIEERPELIHYFCFERSQFERDLPKIRRRMRADAILWISWPKKTSGVISDMTEHVVRAVALPTGLVDVKICAVDEVWSGLKLVIRLEHRAAQI